MDDQYVLINQPYTIYLQFDDDDGDIMTYSVNDHLSFVDIDQTNSKFIGTPKVGDDGDYSIIITAVDGFGGNATAPLIINVDYTDFDKFMEIIRIFLPVFSTLGGLYATYKNRGLLRMMRIRNGFVDF